MTRAMRCDRGFTLLEVAIALAVVAIALLALAGTGSHATRHAADLRERTLALWVAENLVAEERLRADGPRRGRFQGSRRMGPREWHWVMLVQPSPEPAVYRIDVIVHRDPDLEQPILQHTGFRLAP